MGQLQSNAHAIATPLAVAVANLAETFPEESSHIFRQALSWQTAVSAAALDGEDCIITGNSARSVAASAGGKPLLHLEDGVIHVLTVAGLARVLTLAPDLAAEVDAFLTGNPMALSAMTTAKYTPDMADLVSLRAGGASDILYRLVLQLQAVMVKLLQLSSPVDMPVTLESASAEIALLRAFAGLDAFNCVESAGWESAFVFSTGCRAPPWRQVLGDIGYVDVHLVDGLPLSILVHTSGFWVIKGAVDGAMHYDKVGETYPTLAALLTAQSPAFIAKYQQQLLRYRPASEDKGAVVDTELESASGVLERMNAAAKATRANKILQPSQPWSNLGLPQLPFAPLAPQRKKRGVTSGKGKRGGNGGARGLSSMAENGVAPFDSDSSDNDDVEMEKKIKTSDLPPEYWSIQKLMKFLSGGNQTASIIALCSLRDYDLTSEACQFAIRNAGGLELLVNLLETEDSRCKVGALRVLRDISQNYHVKAAMANLDCMRPLVQLLSADHPEIQALAAATIANCAKYPRNRLRVRYYDGIEKLVALLQSPPDSPDGANERGRCAALALWSCSVSDRNKARILAANATPVLGLLLQSPNIPLQVAVVGVLEECANQQAFRDLIRDLGLVSFLVSNLSRVGSTVELQAQSASAIFKCAHDPQTRAALTGGLAALVGLLPNPDPTLRYGVTGALWKCAEEPANRECLVDLKALEQLASLLVDQPERVVINVAGAISELATTAKARKTIRANGLDALVQLLSGTSEALLVNVTKAVGACAQDVESMVVVDRLDGVRLLWSLLKSPNHDVVANAAWALGPCIEYAKDSGDMVRSFVGGLELIVGLLKSEHVVVVASVCAALAQIAKDQENLAVITDHGVVPLLGRLCRTTNPLLQQHLATVVANCCNWADNRVAFGQAGAVAPLVKYLKTASPIVHRETARALCQLSRNAPNCITMHQQGVVKLLLAMVGSEDEALQVSAATCISNIRRLALAAERAMS